MATVQTRDTAVQGEYVRLYCRFIKNGQVMDPQTQPRVRIVDNDYYLDSSSTSSQSESSASYDSSTSGSISSSSTAATYGMGRGPFWAQRESTGVWYIEWYVPPGQAIGDLYDVWTFQWDQASAVEEYTFDFSISASDSFINWVSPSVVHKIDNRTAQLMNDLSNLFLHEAMHIPVYQEQGYWGKDRKTLNFAYPNWQRSPGLLLRKNNRIITTGYYADYDGTVKLERAADPEDMFYGTYQFKYFSDEELLDFLNMGLYAMNSTPPASTYYQSLEAAPFEWRYGILLMGAVHALKRLVFGFNFIERAFVLGETGDEQQRKIDNFKELYKEYQETFATQAENVKSKKLPSTLQIVVPEYTLPGGRSRWYRYMYKMVIWAFIPTLILGSILSRPSTDTPDREIRQEYLYQA